MRHQPHIDHRTALAALLSLTVAVSARAQDRATTSSSGPDSTRHFALDTVRVRGRIDDLHGQATSASEGHVGAAELRLRPISREGELLETVPGMIVTQHSGDGKANQYFVRGFNLDHGTDFQTRLEGMPLNMPSHGHGQGYTDLNFLIPEFVDHIDYALGVYHPEIGDFGSAGGAEFHLLDTIARPFAAAEYGENRFARLVAGGSTNLGRGSLLVGGEGKTYDGPWQVPERVRKLSGVARYSHGPSTSHFSLLALAYRNRWNAADQIPLRAVQKGLVSRFGELDSTDGGQSQRYSLSANFTHVGLRSLQRAQAFAVYSDLALFSNFTYFLDDPSRGDQFSQTDRRVILGGNFTHTQNLPAAGGSHTLTLGVQSRSDLIDGVGLFRTQDRVRYATVRQDDVNETGAGAFFSIESRWHPQFRTMLGARADAYAFDVSSSNADNSGTRSAAIVSPKASIAYAPTGSTELYLSGGFGFHSNDARGMTITVDPSTGDPAARVDPLVRSRGAEVGLRTSVVDGLRTTASAWLLNLDSELLFTGDAGITEPSAASRRRGVTLANFYRPAPLLALDADLSLARAAFVGVPAGETHVPGAIENVMTAGITLGSAASRASAMIRLRHFGAYPLMEDNSLRARASNLVNADVGYLIFSDTRLRLDVLNLLNAAADDIQYAYASRLRGEASDGVDDVHFHPAEPRQVRVSVQHQF